MSLILLNLLISSLLGCLLGAGLVALVLRWQKRLRIRRAEIKAQEIRSAAQARAAAGLEVAEKRAAEVESRIRQRYHKEVASLQSRLKLREESAKKARSEADREYAEEDRLLQQSANAVRSQHEQITRREAQFHDHQKRSNQLRAELVDKWTALANLKIEEVRAQLRSQITEDLHLQAKRKALAYYEDIRANADILAKRILSNALSRFPRPYCSERGIGVVQLPEQELAKRLEASAHELLKVLENACGVDVSIVRETSTFAVSGFDPVRRELATRSLEKILTVKSLTAEKIVKIVEDNKTDLFRRIEEDGRKVARELSQENFHPEIQSMLGALRYRYSFAQNQYYHVAEVGWLCGLLAAEIGEHIGSAKRAGLLHDIGKAMDHSVEGGHAVIGADFIQTRGELPAVVHAVRAHHYEEQPKTDLAFLVIAADAISGARPGARRSTVSSYNQKMEALESVADGFPGVNKTLVFNAGREVRVIVDGAKITDLQALALSRKIANKIEAELTYPGQIKVVVVRETHAEAIAK